MADTIRKKADILTLLADNTSQLISPQDLRDAVVSMWGVYGFMYVADGSSSQTVNIAAAKLTLWASNGASNGLTVDATTDDDITVDAGSDGVFVVWGQFSFTGTASKVFQFHARKNGGEVSGLGCRVMLDGSGNEAHCGFVGLVSGVVATDVFTVYVECDTDSSSMTLKDGQFGLLRIS